MNRSEVKNLLKRRDSMLELYNKLCDDSDNVNNTLELNNIYKNSRNTISATIHDIDKQLLKYVKESPVGEWLLQIKGMTPDVAAGLLAYFNIKNKDCAAQFIKYSGSDNCSSSHNTTVRAIMDKLKNNFKSQPDSLYFKLNNNKFTELMVGGNTVAISSIRADRYMRKIFISHLFEEMYREEHDGKLPERHNNSNCIIIEPEVPYTK